jgi:hypothetical protein
MYINSYPGLDRHLGLQEDKVPGISKETAHKVEHFLSPKHWPPLTPGDSPATHFVSIWVAPKGRRAEERIKSMENPSDHIGNRTVDILTVVQFLN